jgi:hypothetical protein
MYACPFESNVPLEKSPVEPIDTSLLGYWYGIVKDGSDFFGIEALDISKQSDSSFAIIRYGKAIKGDIILPDTSYFTGFTSYIGEQRYMTITPKIEPLSPVKKGQHIKQPDEIYYIAAWGLRHDTLDVRTIDENFSVRKYYSSAADLKQQVSDLISKKKNVFDEQYSLSYRKIPKPQPFR